MHMSCPTVMPFPIHLPEQYTCPYDPDKVSIREALKSIDHQVDGIFCEANMMYLDDVPNIIHKYILSTFTWSIEHLMWLSREDTHAASVGRIVAIHGRQGDMYYLQLLLKKIKGAVSFDVLETVNDTTHDNF